jgi:hypothetical protein
MKRYVAVAALVLSVSFADTLTLRSGRVVSGSYLGGDSRQIRMAVGERIDRFQVADVVRIEFGSLAATDVAPPAADPNAVRAAETARPDARALRTDRNSPQAATSGMEIPAGTTLTVRMIDSVDSRTDRVGQTYRASLDEPIMVNGDVIVQRGVDVVAKLVNDQQSGRMTGKTILTLDLESITVEGRNIPIATQEVERASGSRTKKTGLATGGLAALGAAIGGIAGGGKGAAIGAVSGAGAGAAGSVLMKGEQVKVPSETRLTFTLQQPLKI